MGIFIEWEGIKGNVTAEGYKDHIAAESVDFGVTRPITMKSGALANRESGKPELSEVHISKIMDNSAASLFKEAVTGSKGTKVVIKFVRTGADKVDEYLTYTLTNCLISSYTVSGQTEGEAHEQIALSYSAAEIMYQDSDASNKSNGPMRANYNIETAKAG